ncbi:hypothetical protein MA16_Dca026413 [Dendrobium catenatum]|uniref:Uncharacterized protein n=1 Tax=Dendrobium catenatum TaxID=906689 RepID=A0A2I0VD99_9ASPA|nr:hypothetical protein MA16_Dca026413 [Dendrobium catenatum]
MMASRLPSGAGTGGRPEVRLRVGGYELSPEFPRTDGRDGLGSWRKIHLPRARTDGIELEGARIDARWKGAPSQRAHEPQAGEPQPLEGFGSGMSGGDHRSFLSIGFDRRRPWFGSG